MAGVLLLFTVLCSVLVAETAVDIQKKKIVLKTIAQCKGQQSLPMIWYGLETKRDPNTGVITLGLKAETKTEVSNDLAIVFNFWKCDASGNPDSCEQFVKDYNVSDICTLMPAKNQAWTAFMDSLVTPLTCPIKPGVYEAKGMEVSPEFLNYLPIGDAVWKIQMEGYDRGKKLTCVLIVIQIVPNLVRRRRPS